MPDQQLFAGVDLQSGWEVRPNRTGVRQKILADSLDARAKTGHCTRLVEFAANTSAPAAAHDYWEEIYIVSGDMSLIDETGAVVSRFDAPSHVCRPAGEVHGPFASEAGCLLLTIEYFGPR